MEQYNKVMKEILNMEPIILKEYGRNIQNIVNFILKIEDRNKRSQYAKTLIELMRQINPSMKDAQDSYHKIWDHLYIMSNFELDVDSPFPKPLTSIFDKKPMRVAYNMHNLRFKHYGRNIELLIQKAIEMEDKEEQEAAIIYVGRLMKRFYASWNKENVDDEVIVGHLHSMSGNKLKIDLEKVRNENLFEIPKEKEFRQSSGNGGYSNNYGQGNNNGQRKMKRPHQDKRKRQ